MRFTWASLAFLNAASAVDTYAAVAAKSCTGAIGCQGYFRALGVSTSPAGSSFGPPSNVTGLSVAAIGAQVAANNATAIVNAKVDVGGFRFKTPADTSDSNSALSFYFGYLGITGSWDTSTKTGAMAGALAEVVSNLNSLNVYYNNDNQPGFKWDITGANAGTQDIFNCDVAKTQGYDSLDVKGSIDLKSLTWTAISHTKVQCNTIAALSDAPAGCEIHTLSTSGSNSTLSTSNIVTIDIRIASQPVLINGVRHGPDYAKFDVTVNYPWSAMTGLYDSANARLALIALHAGKSGAFVGAAKRNTDGTNSLLFTTETGQTSRFSYTNNATIDGQIGPIYTQVITGAQVSAFACTGACILSATNIVQASLKLTVGWLEAFGWKSSLTIHSLGSDAHPANVFWDPEVGAGPSSNSAGFMAPSFFLVALVASLFH